MKKGTIFILEDNLEMSRMYSRAFRLAEYDVVLAHDGTTALKELTAMTPTPAAIILDIMVPNMNGLDVMIALRKDPRFDTTPIAVLTNSFYKEESERFLAAGADLYLIKSDNLIKEVITKIQALVHSGRSAELSKM